MQYEIKHVTNELSNLVSELNRDSRSSENIRVFGENYERDCWRWDIFAEPKGSKSTIFAGVRYYPEKCVFLVHCIGTYELGEIDEVKDRIREKFL